MNRPTQKPGDCRSPRIGRNSLELSFIGTTPPSDSKRVPAAASLLAQLFARDGYQVRVCSSKKSRLGRLVDSVSKTLLWSGSIDVAIVDVFSGPAFHLADLSSRILRARNVPVIFVLRGGNLPSFFRKHPDRVVRVLNRGVRVAPSHFLHRFFEDQGLPTAMIPNVLLLERYTFERRVTPRPRMFWMRSFHPIYNPEMAVSVLSLVKREYPDALLTMAGPDRGAVESVRQKIAEKDLTPHVRLVGFLEQEAKLQAFAEHDIYLNTNHVDNMPTSILEAAASGLPIVATSVGGIPLMLRHEETGLLVQDEDARAMADSVLRLLGDQQLSSRLSDNGRRLAAQCEWNQVRPLWERLLDDVVNPHARARSSAEPARNMDEKR